MRKDEALNELWITLAQAFLPPMRAEVRDAFHTALADDLAALLEASRLDGGDEIEAFRRAVAPLAGSALLVHYSGLFLAPPVRAHLNLAYLLDGSLNGPAQDAVEAAFAAHGIAKKDSLGDLPDHISPQLEFLAMLAAKDSEEQAAYARSLLLPAIRRLCAQIETADGSDSPYLYLARIATLALASYPSDVQVARGPHRRARRPPDVAKGVWQSCARCGKPFARAKEIRIMVKALEAKGLATAHLSVCPDCRNPLAA